MAPDIHPGRSLPPRTGLHPRFKFYRMHIPTGGRMLETREFLSRLQFLEELNRWNGQQPGRWQYWESTDR